MADGKAGPAGDNGDEGHGEPPFLTTPPVQTQPADPAVAGRTYRILGLQDLFLDWAGRREGPVHEHLARLRFGSPVRLHLEKPRIALADDAGHTVAVLSQMGDSRIRPLRERVESSRVVAVALRVRDDSSPEYRPLLRVDSWRVPVVELRLRAA